MFTPSWLKNMIFQSWILVSLGFIIVGFVFMALFISNVDRPSSGIASALSISVGTSLLMIRLLRKRIR